MTRKEPSPDEQAIVPSDGQLSTHVSSGLVRRGLEIWDDLSVIRENEIVLGKPRWLPSNNAQHIFPCEVLHLSFSKDGTLLASSNDKNIINVWDLESGFSIHRFTESSRLPDDPYNKLNDRILCIEFTPDGHYLLCGKGTGEIVLWDVEKGHEINRFIASALDKYMKNAYAPVIGIKALQEPLQAFIMGGYEDAHMRKWDCSRGLLLSENGETDKICIGCKVVFSENGRRFVTIDPPTDVTDDEICDFPIRVWELDTAGVFSSRNINQFTWEPSTISSDGNLVACQHYDEKLDPDGSMATMCVEIFDVNRFEKIAVFPFEEHKFLSRGGLAFSKDNRFLFCGDRDGDITLCDIVRKIKCWTVKGIERGVTSICMSPDGKTLATGGRSSEIALWPLQACNSAGSS
jgi:WD40 repeat protein